MRLGELSFCHGEVLKAARLNVLRQYIDEIANRYEVSINVTDPFEEGTVLRADQLNALRGTIGRIYRKVGQHCRWSFPPFKDGQILRAEHLNEFVGKLRALERK